MAKELSTLISFDPYDLWSTSIGVKVREQYYKGLLVGKAGAVTLGVLDWLTPTITRRLTRANPRAYPIVIAHEILRLHHLEQLSEELASSLFFQLVECAADSSDKKDWSWGLGFSWMSKNGLYPDTIPFVTHTPYAMEALLVLATYPDLKEMAMQTFLGTWGFLESLKIMYQDDEQLALSYAPIDEPRIVINANTYAAYAYAMHAIYGDESNKEYAIAKVKKITRWVITQQHNDGSWDYYADKELGNFIDCFHSCFVVKNLLKVQKLLPDISIFSNDAITNGWEYIQTRLYDPEKRMCRRFIEKNIKDPYVWDLYDQAEYLGLLIEFGELEQARKFEKNISTHFSKKDDWYCKVDIFNRKWGKDFQRWGIAPFKLAQSQLLSKGKQD